MAEREASGEFDYLIGDVTDIASSTGASPGDPLPSPAPQVSSQVPPLRAGSPEFERPNHQPEDRLWVGELDGVVEDRSFDAFDERTWYFEPAPVPWYRTKRALTALVATAVAASALVVSVVVLVFRAPNTAQQDTTPVTQTAPMTAATSASATRPQPPPPPPPAETSAEPMAPPVQTVERSRTPRTTKEPEIGVTRTPVTRSQLSVAPQRPGRP